MNRDSKSYLLIAWVGLRNKTFNTLLIDAFDTKSDYKISYGHVAKSSRTPLITEGITSTKEYIAWTSTSGHLNLASINIWLGRIYNKIVSAERSPFGPGMTEDGSVIAWIGTNSRLTFGVDLKRDGSFTFKCTLQDLCFSNPNVIKLDEFRVITGYVGSYRKLSFVVFNVETKKVEESFIINEVSRSTPGLCLPVNEGNNFLAIAWSNRNGALYFGLLSLKSRSIVWQRSAQEKTYLQPSIATDRKHYFLAWTGDDSHLNVAIIEEKEIISQRSLTYSSFMGPCIRHVSVG